MSSKHINQLSYLIKGIQGSDLTELSKTSPAYDIAMDIIDNQDPQEEDHEMARILSDPWNWGIADQAWKDFILAWREA